MLTEDTKWFQLKSQRLILELVSILNRLLTLRPEDDELQAKIQYIKSSNLSVLEQIFLSPEGRQWIFFMYRELREKSQPEQSLEDYACWLKIKSEEVINYLIGKLDSFILSILVQDDQHSGTVFTIKVANGSVIIGPYDQFETLSHLKINVDKSSMVKINSENGIYFIEYYNIEDKESFKTKLQLLPFYIDLVSEASRVDFPGRETLPRINKFDQAVLEEQEQIIETALPYLEVYDVSLYNYFKNTTNYFVPLVGPEGSLPSSSNSSVDTMIWYSVTRNPLLMAEMIVHEMSHQRLFRFQDHDPLIDPEVHGNGWQKCEVYSPWRDDPRPVNGVLHGFVVFSEAAKFWATLLNNSPLSDREMNIAQRRMAMLVLQLKFAQESLKDCAFTKIGTKIYKSYRENLKTVLLPYVETNNLGKLQPYFMEYHDQESPSGDSIFEVVNSHLAQWKVRNEK